nr:hypothetical protein [Mangrovivirga halotolerans]
MVVAGILIALGVNDWSADQKKSKTEIEVLKSIKSGLEEDRKDLIFNANDLKKRIQYSENILEAIENQTSYDSLYYQLGRVSINTSFLHSTSAFETLKANGITLITNEKLRDAIISVYDSNYDFFIEEEKNINKYTRYGIDFIYPTRIEEYLKINEATNQFIAKPVNLELLKSDQEFLYYFKTHKNRLIILLRIFNARLLIQIDELIEAIEVEIKRLES